MRLATLTLLTLAMSAQAGTLAVSDGSVTFIPAARVTTAFAKGEPLVENGLYKVHASRREGPGMAEVHVRDTDIIYVLEGSATIVTGGQVVDGKTTATDEIRGRSITGGTERRLAKGDLFIVPNGVPHWFSEVQAPFLYYVVKTTSAARRYAMKTRRLALVSAAFALACGLLAPHSVRRAACGAASHRWAAGCRHRPSHQGRRRSRSRSMEICRRATERSGFAWARTGLEALWPVCENRRRDAEGRWCRLRRFRVAEDRRDIARGPADEREADVQLVSHQRHHSIARRRSLTRRGRPSSSRSWSTTTRKSGSTGSCHGRSVRPGVPW